MKLYKNLNLALKERSNVLALKLTIKGGNFPDDIFNLPNLSELYLDGDCKNFPTKIFGLNELKILSIKWPSFSGNLSSLFQLPKLENLKIIETPLKLLHLPLGHSISPLKSLTLKDCGLSHLPEEISILSLLSEINLSGNQLEELPFSIIDLKKLKRMNLDHNLFKFFPDNIKKNSMISHLSIDNNLFSEEEKERIQREFHISIH